MIQPFRVYVNPFLAQEENKHTGAHMPIVVVCHNISITIYQLQYQNRLFDEIQIGLGFDDICPPVNQPPTGNEHTIGPQSQSL